MLRSGTNAIKIGPNKFIRQVTNAREFYDDVRQQQEWIRKGKENQATKLERLEKRRTKLAIQRELPFAYPAKTKPFFRLEGQDGVFVPTRKRKGNTRAYCTENKRSRFFARANEEEIQAALDAIAAKRSATLEDVLRAR